MRGQKFSKAKKVDDVIQGVFMYIVIENFFNFGELSRDYFINK
jgi:hypothetical protein